MDLDEDEPTAAVARTLESEMDLIRHAIAMVAGGGASRVTVANLRLAETLLAPAILLAAETGVRLVPLWTADDAGLDITIERIDG
jgi:hypothetical protein